MSPPTSPDPVLDALIRAGVNATAAARGWLLAVVEGELRVVAGYGGDAPHWFSARGPIGGWAGSVIVSRRPVAVSPESDDPRFAGDLVVGRGSRPASLLCFPCSFEGRPVGAVQLVDKGGGAPFSIDDVELVLMLAEIAGAAIDDAAGDLGAPIPSPEELGRALRWIAGVDADRYAMVADVVSGLLGG